MAKFAGSNGGGAVELGSGHWQGISMSKMHTCLCRELVYLHTRFYNFAARSFVSILAPSLTCHIDRP